MKDYHDVVLMIRDPSLLNPKKLTDAISATFKQRKTQLQFPISFEPKEIQTLQKYWANHLRGLGAYRKKLNLPEKIDDVVSEINDYVITRQV